MQRQKHVESLPIRIKEDKLIVEHLTLESEDVVRYFDEVPLDARLERFEQALAIGTTALRTMQTYENLDLIDRKFTRLSSTFEAKLKEMLDVIKKEVDDKFGKKGDVTLVVEKHFGKDGEVAALMDDYFGEDGQLSNLVETHFGKKGSFIEVVEKYFGEKGVFSELVEDMVGDKGKLKELLDPGKKGTPFNLLLEEIKQENTQLITRILEEKAKEEIKAKTTLKGYEFEDWVYDALCEIARASKAGDIVERVSTETSASLAKSKKGDFVISPGETKDVKIVVEAKGGSSGLGSIRVIKILLDHAMKSRDAQYGILVAKHRDALPAFVGYFNEYDNMLVCALSKNGDPTLDYEILDVAYKWAKLQTLKRSQGGGKFTAADIRKGLRTAKIELDEFQKILAQCDNIDSATAGIRASCSNMRSRLSTTIESLLGSLAA